jgi:hypothetical protein
VGGCLCEWMLVWGARVLVVWGVTMPCRCTESGSVYHVPLKHPRLATINCTRWLRSGCDNVVCSLLCCPAGSGHAAQEFEQGLRALLSGEHVNPHEPAAGTPLPCSAALHCQARLNRVCCADSTRPALAQQVAFSNAPTRIWQLGTV